MSQFDIMNGVVDEICKSLVEEPHRWEFSSFTFKHKRAKVEYWVICQAPLLHTFGLIIRETEFFLMNKAKNL